MSAAVRSRNVTAAAVAALLVAAGCGPARHDAGPPPTPVQSVSPSVTPSPTATPTVVVGGRVVSLAGLTDVQSALAAAGVTVADGRLLAVVSRRVLNAHFSRGYVLLDGTRAALADPVTAGDVISVVAGHDAVEPTKTVTIAVRLSTAATALYAEVRAGVGRAVVGAVSGERVSQRVLTAPQVGRLRRAAGAALTFDDGPDPTYTPEVLALLTPTKVPATFCLIGSHALTHPAVVRAEVAAGARLCDHTQTHPLNLPKLSSSTITAQIRTGMQSVVTSSGGVKPVYFRAPGGNWSALVERIATGFGLALLRWTVDPKDWTRPGTPAIVTQVLDQLRPGGIILLHDGGGDRSQTVAALRILIPELSAAGWRFGFPPAVVTTR